MQRMFPRRGRRSDPSRPRSRRGTPVTVNRVDLAELTPPLARFLGHAAYLQLSLFEVLSQCVTAAPATRSKESLSRAAAIVLARHHGAIAMLKSLGEDPSTAMEPFVAPVDRFRTATRGNDWYELLITSYVTSGILDDCLVQVAGGLPGEYPRRIADLFGPDDARELLVHELRTAIDANPQLASRLALWGRRLVGDTLLAARSMLELPENTAPDDARLEPVFTELIAAHTRRMDELGLTA